MREWHGYSSRRAVTPEYRAWSGIKNRCCNSRCVAFKDYGGRGISICREWRESFTSFLAHVGHRPGAGYSIDRIDNNRGYEPGNVRWATASEQAQNRRKRSLDVKGRKLTRQEALEVKLAALRGESALAIARRYGVSDALVFMIRKNKVWKDIEHAGA